MDDIPKRGRFKCTVIGTDTDISDRLTPHALFGYKQEAATIHAEENGMTAYAEAANGVWLLRRSRAVWTVRPSYRDEITVETWSRGVSLMTFLRDYRFYVNGSSIPAGAGSSEWIIADKDTHKPLRPYAVIPQDIVARLSDTDVAIDRKAVRLADPAVPAEKVMQRDIGYSELDHNDHVNNTFYLRYGVDAVARYEALRGASCGLDFRFLDVVYLRELSLGDVLDVLVAKEDRHYYVEGKKQDGERCFRMILEPSA